MSAVEDLAERLAARPKREVFTVHRYDAATTKSIYLKLDYGLGNSIRISDHEGKDYAYRFNIGTWIECRRDDYSGEHVRSHYAPFDFETMVADIVRARYERKRHYGERAYSKRMEKFRQSRDKPHGFWRNARRVR